MSKKSRTVEAAASGDMSAAISEEVKSAPKEVLMAAQRVLEKPAFVPTHIFKGDGSKVVIEPYEGAGKNRVCIRHLDGPYSGSRTIAMLNEIIPIRVEKPAFEPTHLETSFNPPVPVRLGRNINATSCFVEDETGRRFVGYAEYLTPIEEKIMTDETEDPLKSVGKRIVEKLVPESEPQELVEFTITRSMFRDHVVGPHIEDAFGVKAGDYANHQDLKVTCRPDQFGRFMALLYMNCLDTRKIVSTRIFRPAPPKPENRIDASANH